MGMARFQIRERLLSEVNSPCASAQPPHGFPNSTSSAYRGPRLTRRQAPLVVGASIRSTQTVWPLFVRGLISTWPAHLLASGFREADRGRAKQLIGGRPHVQNLIMQLRPRSRSIGRAMQHGRPVYWLLKATSRGGRARRRMSEDLLASLPPRGANGPPT
jgi:hypothetical protein